MKELIENTAFKKNVFFKLILARIDLIHALLTSKYDISLIYIKNARKMYDSSKV
jgi:hypothetical protein